MIAGNGVYICDQCVELCMSIIEDGEMAAHNHEDNEVVFDNSHLLKPKELKAILDDYVIGQDSAKITLSVAVYNHYKRILNHDEDVDFAKSNLLFYRHRAVLGLYQQACILLSLVDGQCRHGVHIATELGKRFQLPVLCLVNL